MKIEVNKNKKNIKDIKTAVCYKGSYDKTGSIIFKYVPNTKDSESFFSISNHIYSDLQYLGTNERLENNDFAEYEFSHLINKGKFNDNLLINQLDNNSRNLINLNTEISTTVESCLFPSLGLNSERPRFKYFGSSTYQSSKFFSFDLDEGVYKLELYDEIVESNYDGSFYEFDALKYSNISADIEPSIIITLGPDRNDLRNSESWYYENDGIRSETLSKAAEYGKLLNELNFRKVINIYLPEKENQDIEVNVSLEAWKDDNKNPNRNTHLQVLINDYFHGSKNKINPIQKNNYTNLKYDINSMTLVSNSEMVPLNDCPILRSKVSKLNNEIRTVGNSNWQSSIRYNLGDVVSYNNIIWESLVENNIGNNPQLSSVWEEIDKLTNYYTNRLSVSFYDSVFENVGVIKPAGDIIITDDTENIELSVKENTGFDLVTDTLYIYPPYNGSSELPLVRDSEVLNGYNYEHFKSQDLGHIFIFSKNQINLLKEIDYLYFKTTSKNYNINFQVTVNYGDRVDNLSWSSWSSDNKNISLTATLSSNSGTITEYKLDDKNSSFISSTQDIINLELKDSSGIYKLDSVVTNRDEVIPSNDDKVNNIIVNPLPEDDTKSSILYTLMINSTPIKLRVEKFDNFVVEKAQQIIKINESGLVRFYVSDSDKEFDKASIEVGDRRLEFRAGEKLGVNGCIISLTDNPDGIYSLEFTRISTNINIELHAI